MPQQSSDTPIISRRLHTQRLVRTQFASPSDVVSFLTAVQGQDTLYSLWALGMRVAGATEAAVEQTIADRQLVRTWPMRTTLHYVTAADARWIVKLNAERTLRGMARRLRDVGLDDDTLARAQSVITTALQANGPMARPELLQKLDDAGISPTGQRGYYMIWYFANQGLTAIGPRIGKQQSVVLLDEWLPPSKERTRDEALAELARRYFTGHGPAQLKDFVWWSSLTTTEARAGLEAIKSHLARETFDGKEYWYDPEQSTGEMPSPTAHLLPYLDEYIVAYRHRDDFLDAAYNQRVESGNVIFHAPLLIDGRVAGYWKRTLKRAQVIIEVTPFRPLSKVERDAVADAADRFGAFVELPAEIMWME